MHRMTKKGLALLGKQQVGLAQPNITRVVAGSGYVAPELLEEQTGVSGFIAEMEVGAKQLVDGMIVRLPIQLTNLHLTETALIRQIGVYSNDPDEGEILYQIVQYEQPVALPAYASNSGGVILFDPELDVLFANGAIASTPLTPGFLVTTDKMDRAFSQHNTDPNTHPDIRELVGGSVGEQISAHIYNKHPHPEIDCGSFEDDDDLLAHMLNPVAHKNMSIDGNVSGVSTATTLKEHAEDPYAHPNLIIDGND